MGVVQVGSLPTTPSRMLAIPPAPLHPSKSPQDLGMLSTCGVGGGSPAGPGRVKLRGRIMTTTTIEPSKGTHNAEMVHALTVKLFNFVISFYNKF